MDTPLYQITSHIQGKNAKVSVYSDRVEWERGKTMSGAKVTAAVLTVGMSAAATGLRTRKGAGTEVIPMRSITSVTTKRDSMFNDVVSVITSGSTIEMRCSRAEGERLKHFIMAGINGQLQPVVQAATMPAPATVQPVAASVPPPPPPADAPPANWFPDPHGVARLRYWDGAAWTEHTAP